MSPSGASRARRERVTSILGQIPKRRAIQWKTGDLPHRCLAASRSQHWRKSRARLAPSSTRDGRRGPSLSCTRGRDDGGAHLRGDASEMGFGGRHWTRTSDLLHVKHFRLSAVLGAWQGRAKRPQLYGHDIWSGEDPRLRAGHLVPACHYGRGTPRVSRRRHSPGGTASGQLR